MIVLLSLACWVPALLAHGLLQPKTRRLLHVGGGRPGVLRGMRLGLPLVGLVVCGRLEMPLSILVWVGTFSVGGLLAGGALAAVAAFRRGGC